MGCFFSFRHTNSYNKNMDQDFNKSHWTQPCPKIDCRKKACECGLQYVFIASALGDNSDGSPSAPKNGEYCNAIVEYEATGAIYVYSADGVPVMVTGTDPGDLDKKIKRLTDALAEEASTRATSDELLQEGLDTKQNTISPTNMLSSDLVNDTNATHKFVTSAQIDSIGTAVQPSDINYVVMTDLDVDANPSTSITKLDASQVNISSGVTASKEIPLPVASTTQAGVMNSATFNAVSENSSNINALLNGAVAVTGLPATPTQSELTTAWETEAGLTTLINRAQIYDVTNEKIWTYYTNDTTWHEAPAGGTISINTFTNNSEGVIKGSTNAGQVFAENDGTGSVNGWDSLSSQVTNNTNNLLRVGSVLSEPSSVAYVDTVNLVDDAVTADKIDFGTIRRNLYTATSSTTVVSDIGLDDDVSNYDALEIWYNQSGHSGAQSYTKVYSGSYDGFILDATYRDVGAFISIYGVKFTASGTSIQAVRGAGISFGLDNGVVSGTTKNNEMVIRKVVGVKES